jgi:hypothetical protein
MLRRRRFNPDKMCIEYSLADMAERWYGSVRCLATECLYEWDYVGDDTA